MMDNCMEIHGRHLDLSNRKDIVEYVIPKMIEFLTNLDVIWDDIGLTTDDRKQKGLSIIEHVKGLFSDMLQEAKDLKSNLVHTNKSHEEKLLELAKELRIDISADIKGYECMPLNTVHNDLKEKIAKYRDKYVSLYNEAEELNAIGKNLCHDLGKKEKYLCTSPLPTKDEIINFKTYINNLSDEKIKREENFLTMKSEIIEMMKDIGVEPTLTFEKNVLRDNDFLLTDENMKQLTKWHSALKDQQSDLHSRISDLREKINVYWERLEESPKKRSEFSIKYAGNNINTYEALKVEESRCRDEIKANFKIFIDKMRQEISKWWNQCYFGDEEKKEFIHFESALYTEDLLTLHERYIDKLKNHFETNKNIYDLISKRTELWERLQELEERAINPDRLKNRGGQLLREEKERNSVKARLPKVEQQLLKLVADYEEKYNTPFVIFGQRVSEMIDSDWEQFKENRHTQISANKQARENLKTSAPSTPKTPKRKLAIPLFGSASAKKNKSSNKKIVPKIQVTASTINKRASLERRKRMERRKRSVGQKNESKTTNTTDYDHFELGLEDKATCRSTLGKGKIQNTNNNNAGPSCTSILLRTPSRSNLRAKSPANGTKRLTPKHLPIIF